MKYKAIVSAHIWLNGGHEEIEILSMTHNDEKATGIFDDIDHALLHEIEIGGSQDYYFIAIIESRFVEHRTWEGSEWEVEHEVREIKSIQDIASQFEQKAK
ncbi:hypothetical protein [Paenibacillus sp. XY044]|uniref:hypothetical protein n=1 Tax=Paenibacillus sp. XY044 TaxID=2026089 RepID=UPI000B98E16D|nr:hypothetical protein [Paenibacillus sp. XY044]OZB98114.1 hypothetical protein CJP46_02800 [Paenibacillus sp. XY044]